MAVMRTQIGQLLRCGSSRACIRYSEVIFYPIRDNPYYA